MEAPIAINGMVAVAAAPTARASTPVITLVTVEAVPTTVAPNPITRIEIINIITCFLFFLWFLYYKRLFVIYFCNLYYFLSCHFDISEFVFFHLINISNQFSNLLSYMIWIQISVLMIVIPKHISDLLLVTYLFDRFNSNNKLFWSNFISLC